MIAAALLLAVAVLLSGSCAGARTRVAKASTRPTPNAADCRPDPFAAASAFDVLAVCLGAGMTVPAAAAATVPGAPPGLRAVLQRAADLLRLGADPDTAWQNPGDQSGNGCEALTRLARRSASSGSALAAGVADLAEQARQDVGHAATAAAERSGVLIAGPLGLCFLPAFVCLGIVPVVAGLAGEIFGAGSL